MERTSVLAAGMAIMNKVKGGDFRFHDHNAALGIYLGKYRRPIELADLKRPEEFFMDIIYKTPQPTKEKIKQQQQKLLKTFPFPIVDDPLSSSLKYILEKPNGPLNL